MNEEVRSKAMQMGNVDFFIAPHKTKIEAINSGIDYNTKNWWDVLVNIADDMIPIVKGWDIQIESDMKTRFPLFDGCLWYFDGTQKHFCTMAIMGRLAYEQSGYIYHPSYKSLWCDQEYTEYWLARGKLFKSTFKMFEHIHPASYTMLPKMKWDDLYRRNEDRGSMWNPDEDNYKRRKKLNFPV